MSKKESNTYKEVFKIMENNNSKVCLFFKMNDETTIVRFMGYKENKRDLKKYLSKRLKEIK